MAGPAASTISYWQAFRRVVTFLLGVAVVVDALWDQNFVIPELVVGMILVGILPLEDFVRIVRRRNGASRPPDKPVTPP